VDDFTRRLGLFAATRLIGAPVLPAGLFAQALIYTRLNVDDIGLRFGLFAQALIYLA